MGKCVNFDAISLLHDDTFINKVTVHPRGGITVHYSDYWSQYSFRLPVSQAKQLVQFTKLYNKELNRIKKEASNA